MKTLDYTYTVKPSLIRPSVVTALVFTLSWLSNTSNAEKHLGLAGEDDRSLPLSRSLKLAALMYIAGEQGDWMMQQQSPQFMMAQQHWNMHLSPPCKQSCSFSKK